MSTVVRPAGPDDLVRLQAENDLGLGAHGRRIQMTASVEDMRDGHDA